VREFDSRGVDALHATAEGRSIDRSLVQVKHRRSSIDVGGGTTQATKTVAHADDKRRLRLSRFWMCAALARVEVTAPRRIAGPMKLVCPHGASVAAGLVRNRLHGRPVVNRATATNDTGRSSYR
jgi:hypothetical protein